MAQTPPQNCPRIAPNQIPRGPPDTCPKGCRNLPWDEGIQIMQVEGGRATRRHQQFMSIKLHNINADMLQCKPPLKTPTFHLSNPLRRRLRRYQNFEEVLRSMSPIGGCLKGVYEKGNLKPPLASAYMYPWAWTRLLNAHAYINMCQAIAIHPIWFSNTWYPSNAFTSATHIELESHGMCIVMCIASLQSNRHGIIIATCGTQFYGYKIRMLSKWICECPLLFNPLLLSYDTYTYTYTYTYINTSM